MNIKIGIYKWIVVSLVGAEPNNKASGQDEEVKTKERKSEKNPQPKNSENSTKAIVER